MVFNTLTTACMSSVCSGMSYSFSLKMSASAQHTSLCLAPRQTGGKRHGRRGRGAAVAMTAGVGSAVARERRGISGARQKKHLAHQRVQVSAGGAELIFPAYLAAGAGGGERGAGAPGRPRGAGGGGK